MWTSITCAEGTLHFQPEKQIQSLPLQEIDRQELRRYHPSLKVLYFHHMYSTNGG